MKKLKKRFRPSVSNPLVDMFRERLGEIFGERFGVRFDDRLGWVSRLVKCWIRGRVSLGEGLFER